MYKRLIFPRKNRRKTGFLSKGKPKTKSRHTTLNKSRGINSYLIFLKKMEKKFVRYLAEVGSIDS